MTPVNFRHFKTARKRRFLQRPSLLDSFQTTWFPSPGRLVFVGRTGDANAHHHVDSKICYINRGAVSFATKILNAQAAGAIATNRPGGTSQPVWKSSPGQSFRIHSSLSMATGSWTLRADNVPAGDGTKTTCTGDSNANPPLPNVTTQPQDFFRFFAK